ncbi:MAG TPA: hypothetical protein VM144_16515 [Aestuariivirga sp.]|nr:hypothetical protein [Aestuariivirga sp.]
MSQALLLVLIALIFGGYALYILKEWICDLMFYHSKGWDFSKDSGRKAYPSSSKLKGMVPLSNKQRVFFAYPAIIIVATVSTILILVENFGKLLNG